MSASKISERGILIPHTLKGDPPADFPFKVFRYDNVTCVPDDKAGYNAEALVTFAHPDKAALHTMISKMPLNWVQALFAGIDNLMDAPLRPGTKVCRGAGLHEDNTAELAVGLMISGVKGLHLRRDDQTRKVWDSTIYKRQLDAGDGSQDDHELCTLKHANVLIMGMGKIGLEMARKLKPFKPNIIGMARSAREEEGIPVQPFSELPHLLKWADIVVSALPGGPDTDGMVNKDFLDAMKPRAWLVNVGRGTLVNETALAQALKENSIAGAAIDVHSTEPMPKDSPLWKVRKKIIITPHIGGGGPFLHKEAWDLIATNAKLYLGGNNLKHLVYTKTAPYIL